MGNGPGVNFWHNIPTKSVLPKHIAAWALINLLDRLFRTHGKSVITWETGRPELDTPETYYIAQIEVTTENKYD